MACLFLDKLAPETRLQIYEFALYSDFQLYQVQRFRPFLTGANCERHAALVDDIEDASDSGEAFERRIIPRPPLPGQLFCRLLDRSPELRPVDISLLLVNRQISTEAIQPFFAVNEFLVQRQLITSSFLRSFLRANSPLRYIRHVSLEADWYLLRGEDPQHLVQLLRSLPQNFPAIRSFTIRTDEVSPNHPYIHELCAQCRAQPTELISASYFTTAGRFVADMKLGGFQLIVSQGPEARLFSCYNSLAENDPLLRAAERLTWEQADEDLHDAIRWAVCVKRRYDAGDADAIEMVEDRFNACSWRTAGVTGWQKWSMFIWDMGPMDQKLPEWTRTRG